MNRCTGRIRELRKAAIALAGLAATLLTCTSAQAALSFYAAGNSDGHLYRIDSGTWAATDLGAITVNATSAHTRALSMDFSPDGSLYMLRGRVNISGKPASVFSLDPDTMVAQQLSTVFNTGVGSGTAGDSALTFRGDGKCYVLKVAISNRPIVLVDDSFSAMTGPSVTTYTQSSNPTYMGMEWYDNGTPAGQVYGLSTSTLGYMVLNTLTFPSATGYAGAFFATANTLPSGFTTYGDLTVSGDTLYITVGNASTSRLYSYDLSAGQGGGFTFLAEYGKSFSALAALPQEPIPEPATVVVWSLLGGLVICLAWLRRKAR